MSAGHTSAGARYRWRLAVTFVLVATFFGVEFVVGLLADSLALLSDAGHMAADGVTLGAALAATTIASRADTSGRRTFGSYRAEIFASGFAVLMMIGVSVYIVIEAIGRIGDVARPAYGPMLIVGVLGLLINVVSLVLLRAGAGESLNVKGAYLEVLADAIGSVGVIIAGLLVGWTENPMWDTIIALGIGGFVLVRAAMLGREVLAVLGQHAPKNVEPEEMVAALRGVRGVTEVHDLHVWTLTSGMDVATAHLTAADDSDGAAILESASQTLRKDFGIAHATLQIESSDHTCHGASW